MVVWSVNLVIQSVRVKLYFLFSITPNVSTPDIKILIGLLCQWYCCQFFFNIWVISKTYLYWIVLVFYNNFRKLEALKYFFFLGIEDLDFEEENVDDNITHTKHQLYSFNCSDEFSTNADNSSETSSNISNGTEYGVAYRK